MKYFPHIRGIRRDADERYRKRCSEAFTPFEPIDLPEFFAGRDRHIERFREELAAPGRQVAIFGERGVGKTSFAKLAYDFVGNREDVHFVSCQKTSSFESIFIDVLDSAGVGTIPGGVEAQEVREGKGRVPLIEVTWSQARTAIHRPLSTGQVRPPFLLKQFGERPGMIVIDEYDKVADINTQTQVTELMKYFSDEGSKTKIILVGVADTLSQLIGKHEPVGRSLAKIKLDRMSDAELNNIIKRGQDHLPAVFESSVRDRIVRLADGFPYFVHLVCLCASRAAAKQLVTGPRVRVPTVRYPEYAEGLREALTKAQHRLSEQYEEAVVTTRGPNVKLALVLWGMALAQDLHSPIRDIARNAAALANDDVKTESLNQALGELSTDHCAKILTKVRKGYYRFTDPLMRPYIRAIVEQQSLVGTGSKKPATVEAELTQV
ncbi:MAG: AAA family ATPase, partial [Phycisphaerales bacterium]